MKLIVSCLVFLSCLSGHAQKTENLEIESPNIDTLDITQIHSPRKATIRSAIIPGWGQAYNKKFWKIPIVYVGLGTCVYFIDWNSDDIRIYRSALGNINDDDPNTINFTDLNEQTLELRLEQSRRWRDIAYMSLAGVYILNIIDANVDAHLFHFDVNEDLSMSWSPRIMDPQRASLGIGLTFTLK